MRSPTERQLAAGTYVLDAETSEITFTTRHMFGLGSVTGSFAATSAALQVTDDATEIDATIGAGTFSSGDSRRDAKVKSASFLDADRHPEFVFHADAIEPSGDGWTVQGTLTVRGTSAPASVAVSSVQQDGDSVVVSATTIIDRYALGVTAMKGIAARSLTVAIAARFTRI